MQPNQMNQPQVFPQAAQPRSPSHFARMISDYVRSGIGILAWTVVAAFSLAAAAISLRAIWWAVSSVLRALGGL